MTAPTFNNVTWTTLYDASLGTLPTSQGWTKSGTFDGGSGGNPPLPSGGRLRLTDSTGSAKYTRNSAMPAVQSGKILLCHVRARLESGHVYDSGFQFGVDGLNASQADYDIIGLNGSWAGWGETTYATKSYTTGSAQQSQKSLLSGLADFDLILLWRLSGLNSTQRSHEQWWRLAGSYGVNDASAYQMVVNQLSFTGQNTNAISFGDLISGLGFDMSVTLIRAGWTSSANVLTVSGWPIFAANPTADPTVDLTVSAATVAPAGTVTESATIATGVGVTLGGSAWNGSG
jgi:hypothetical protein